MPPKNKKKKHQKNSKSNEKKNKSPIKPEDVKSLITDAEKFVDMQDYQSAIDILKKALKIDKKSVEVLDLLGICLVNVNSLKLAKEVFEKSIAIDPKNNHLKYVYLGQITKGKESFSYYKKGIEILSNSNEEKKDRSISNIYCSMAELYMTDLCFENDAEKICESCVNSAIKYDKNNIAAYIAHINLKLVQQKKDEARKSMDKIIEFLSNGISTSHETRIIISKLLIELEEYLKAEIILTALSQQWGDSADVWYLLGLCHRETKKYKMALGCFQRALKFVDKEFDEEDFIGSIQAEEKFCKQALSESKGSKDDGDLEMVDDEGQEDKMDD